MSIAIFIVFLFTVIGVWLFLDFTLGKRLNEKELHEYNYPLRHGKLALFSDGNALYKDFFDEIEKAQNEINILFYIVKHDQTSKEFLNILKEKAAQGVTVRLLVDWIGSFRLPRHLIKDLKHNGIHFAYGNKPKLPFLFLSLNRRNHRKITIIDSKIAYLGGFNIGQEYLGLNLTMGYWKDYHLKITGEGTLDLQQQFAFDWKKATTENLLITPPSFSTDLNTVKFRFAATAGKQLEEQFISLICQAEEEVWIGTPYFIPSQGIMNALLDALERKIKVTILVPMRADHLLVREAAYSYLPALLKAGARIFRYYYGFYHSKIIIIDGTMCDIGTANFDRRSLFLNEEINCYIFDKHFVQEVKNNFIKDLKQSEELRLEHLLKRSLLDYGKQGVAKLIEPLL